MPATDPNPDKTFDLAVAAFNRGEFFEAHELWEELWTPSEPPERDFLQALIHFAVGYYHHQRDNRVGALRQLAKGLRKIETYLPQRRGLRLDELASAARRDRATIAAGGKLEAFPQIERR